MISVLTTGWLHVPLQVVKGYELPGFVGKNTLVIATSHSGNTEETLACYQQARQAGCMVGVMTTGGQLLEQAMADNLPYVQLPSGATADVDNVPSSRTVEIITALLCDRQPLVRRDGG